LVAGAASVVLNAPAAPAKGIAMVTAAYTDDLGVARAGKLSVRVVDANEWSLVLEQQTDSVVGPGQIVPLTATVYQGATKKVGQLVNVVLSGPSNIGTLIPKNIGG